MKLGQAAAAVANSRVVDRHEEDITTPTTASTISQTCQQGQKLQSIPKISPGSGTGVVATASLSSSFSLPRQTDSISINFQGGHQQTGLMGGASGWQTGSEAGTASLSDNHQQQQQTFASECTSRNPSGAGIAIAAATASTPRYYSQAMANSSGLICLGNAEKMGLFDGSAPPQPAKRHSLLQSSQRDASTGVVVGPGHLLDTVETVVCSQLLINLVKNRQISDNSLKGSFTKHSIV
ncbi:unnamed protein product [Protopolystoma xenopodis]|uniref:Uncharacterized protein n=1 Tax=Protopolystoma xenopodis TaxID=117903 RepID=A0A448WFW8_9PLAT|nr:unnamed protein product [Protopolystoma xenopodis]